MATNMSQLKKKQKSDSMHLSHPVAVLDDQYYRKVELIDVYVTKVTDKSQIGNLIQQLKTIYPMPNTLNHLKRVKGNEIILTLVQYTTKNECNEVLRAQLTGIQPMIGICKVPREPPKTKQQHVEANALWPCNFHPLKRIEDLLAQKYFSMEEVACQYECMRLALRTAEENGSAVAAVIVDPQNGNVVAVAFDKCSRNPCKHAIIGALDKVAERQKILFQNFTETRRDEQRENVATTIGERNKNQEVQELPYLCTGYDLFVTREPCIMCAMAMVHSRVKRVFYGCATKNGALGSRCKVHTMPSLNHHYLVFKDILIEECIKLLEKFEKIE